MEYRGINGYDRMSLPLFRETLADMLNGMNGKPVFLKQQPQVTELLADEAAFSLQAEKAAKGSRPDITTRDNMRADITVKLHQLVRDVSAMAGNNVVIYQEAGIKYNRKPQPSPDLEKPAPPVLKSTGNPGQITAFGKKQNARNKLTFYITREPGSTNYVQVIPSNKEKITINNLVPGDRYYARFLLSGPRNQEMLSDESVIIAQ